MSPNLFRVCSVLGRPTFLQHPIWSLTSSRYALCRPTLLVNSQSPTSTICPTTSTVSSSPIHRLVPPHQQSVLPIIGRSPFINSQSFPTPLVSPPHQWSHHSPNHWSVLLTSSVGPPTSMVSHSPHHHSVPPYQLLVLSHIIIQSPTLTVSPSQYQ